MSKTVNYEIVSKSSTQIKIRDLGPWDKHQTITNAVETVVKELTDTGLLSDGQQLLYYDSNGNLDEISHKNGKFVAFFPVGRT